MTWTRSAVAPRDNRRRDAYAPARVAAGDAALAITPACGVSYAAWLAGSLPEAVDVIDNALEMAGGDHTTGARQAFVSPYAHAFGHRGQAVGFMGDLEAARRDFDRGIELAREHGDSEVESYAYANLALLHAIVGESETALDASARGREIAEGAGNAIGIVATTTAGAVADADAGRFAVVLERAETNLAMVRAQRMGLYYEPVLLATIARLSGGPRTDAAPAERTQRTPAHPLIAHRGWERSSQPSRASRARKRPDPHELHPLPVLERPRVRSLWSDDNSDGPAAIQFWKLGGQRLGRLPLLRTSCDLDLRRSPGCLIPLWSATS